MSLVVIVCSKVSAVSSTVAMGKLLGRDRWSPPTQQHTPAGISRDVAVTGANTRGAAHHPGRREDGRRAGRPHPRPRDGARRPAGRRAAARDGIPHRGLPQRPAPDAAGPADPTAAAAYAAYRMPATHAAVSRALRHATELADLEVRSVLDVGGGTGAATWAVAEAFPTLSSRRCSTARPTRWRWAVGSRRTGRLRWPRPAGSAMVLGPDTVLPQADLAVVSYVLGELPDAAPRAASRRGMTAGARLCSSSSREPPAASAAVLAARSRLTGAGWHLLAPCPQDGSLPAGRGDGLVPLRGAPRAAPPCTAGSRAGPRARGREVLVRPGARDPASPARARVLRHPFTRKGLVQLEVCRSDGSAGRVVVTEATRGVPYGARRCLGRRGARAPVIASRENRSPASKER